MTATVRAPASPSVTLAELALVRLAIPVNSPPPFSQVRKDLEALLGRDISAEEFAEIREQLQAAGFVAMGKRGSVRPTDSGRARARAFLGIPEFPPRTTWATVQAKYLFPKAAGVTPQAASHLDRDKLSAQAVKRRHGLPAHVGTTLPKVMEALACRELGFPEETTWEGVQRAVLSKLLGTGEKLPLATLRVQLPRHAADVRDNSLAALRRAMIRDWVEGQEAPREPAEFDLAAFANTVKKLARVSPPGDRFHDDRAFIAPLWRASQREPGFPRMSLAEFKSRLVEANGQGLLRLTRADLVEAMDPKLVDESETRYLTAQFHFVIVEGGHP